MQIFCPNCATGNDMEAVTCDNCGAVLRNRRSPIKTPAPNPPPNRSPGPGELSPVASAPRTGAQDTVTCPSCKQVVQLPAGQSVDQTFRCGQCQRTFELQRHQSGWVRPSYLANKQREQRKIQRKQKFSTWFFVLSLGLFVVGVGCYAVIDCIRGAAQEEATFKRWCAERNPEIAKVATQEGKLQGFSPTPSTVKWVQRGIHLYMNHDEMKQEVGYLIGFYWAGKFLADFPARSSVVVVIHGRGKKILYQNSYTRQGIIALGEALARP